jgi:hypothetical protein
MFQKSKPIRNSNYMIEPNHIYFDFTMVNNDTTGTLPPPPLVFTETRNNPIVNNASDYYVSVVRFGVETPTLPLMIPQAVVGQSDPNQLIYTVNLTYEVGGIVYESQTNVQFIPQNVNDPIPKPPINAQDLTSEYYYVFSFQHFVLMVNNALQTAYTALAAAVAPTVLPSALAPYIEYNPTTGDYTLNGDVLGYDSDQNNATSIYIFMNAPCYTLFSSFESKNYGYNNITGGKNFQLVLRNINNGSNIYTPSPPTPSFYQSYGEYPTAPLWNPVESLVFQASLLPIIPEQQTRPLIFNSDVLFGEGGNNSAIGNTLTDLQVYLTTGTEYKPLIQYAPTAEYRLIDMIGENPVNSIQIACFWKDKYGNLNPFRLASGCGASMKILFRKKMFPEIEKEYKEI